MEYLRKSSAKNGMTADWETDEIDLEQTGKRIKKMCEVRGMCVKNVQELLGLGSLQAIYKWFSGKSLPSIDNLMRLSRMLHVPVDYLIVVRGQRETGEYKVIGDFLDYIAKNTPLRRRATFWREGALKIIISEEILTCSGKKEKM